MKTAFWIVLIASLTLVVFGLSINKDKPVVKPIVISTKDTIHPPEKKNIYLPRSQSVCSSGAE